MDVNPAYRPPNLTVDTVVFQLVNDVLSVLLIQRQNEPFKGIWALPGGYNAEGETTSDAMERILDAKGGVKKSDLRLVEQLYTFDTVARDPRGHAVSVTYMGLGIGVEPRTGAGTHSPQFFPVDSLPELAYDHADIIAYAHDRLSSKITYTNAIFALLPELFTLSELQSAYEAVFGRELDKRNFRKKFLTLDLIHETNEQRREGAHRPARLYTFNKQILESLSRSFD
jgi:8-oxo-dGTP diphosphatase